MAELPGLGEQCGVEACRQLDFLPIPCHHCRISFCRHHASAEAHHCTCLPEPTKADLSAVPETYPCHVSGCGSSELTPVTCADCRRPVCLSHRHPPEHGCVVWQAAQVRQERERSSGAQADAVQAARLAAPPVVAAARSERARRTAATVQLMRLKQRSCGDGRVPLADRHYLLLVAPGGRGAARPVFVSRRWTLGRAVDVLADLCSAKNENDVTGGRRLVLYRRADGGRVGDAADTPLSELPAGQLDNGETVVLEYGDPRLPSRADVTQYSLS